MILESLPGVGTVRNFAYPFGDYDARVIAAEEAAGYRSGRSVDEGYNSRLDLEPYDIRVQNMTPGTTPEQFKSWIDYAKAHNYWLVIVYHEVVPESAPRCTNTTADPDAVPGRLRHDSRRLQRPTGRHLVGRPRVGRHDRAEGAGHDRQRNARTRSPGR